MIEAKSLMGLTVQATDGAAGRVEDALLEQETGRLHGLVVQGRGFFGNDVVVPAGAITHVDASHVFVNLTQAEVGRLPQFDTGRHGSAQGLVSQAALGYDRPLEDEKK